MCVCEGQQVADQWYSEIERYDFKHHSGPKTGRPFIRLPDLRRRLSLLLSSFNSFTGFLIWQTVRERYIRDRILSQTQKTDSDILRGFTSLILRRLRNCKICLIFGP